MQKIKYFLILVIIFILGFILINQPSRNLWIPESIRYVKIAGQEIKVEVASMPEERVRGLSGKRGLKEDEGMLFVFDRSGNYPFWMKDMNFPIDMVWIGENMKVIYIKENARPELYPEIYSPDKNAKYVLEVVSGFSQKNNLKVGDSVEFI